MDGILIVNKKYKLSRFYRPGDILLEVKKAFEAYGCLGLTYKIVKADKVLDTFPKQFVILALSQG